MVDLSLPLDAPCPRYPNTHVVLTAPRCDVAPAQGTGQRAMMAQATLAASRKGGSKDGGFKLKMVINGNAIYVIICNYIYI